MPLSTPTPKERYELAADHAVLLRALYNHPQTVVDKTQRGLADRSRMPVTLWNVIDFHYSTWTKYILPLLPKDAPKNSRALADAWDYADPSFTENLELVADEHYPEVKSADLIEKWQDSIGRGVMISTIITNKSQHIMMGGPVEFGNQVEEAARKLLSGI